MKAALCRMAGEGEFEKEWKRLSGFKRARVSTDWPVDVEAARWAMDEEGTLALGAGLLVLPCSDRFPFNGLLLRSQPKLRIHDGETAHLRRACARLCRRAGELEIRTPCRST